MAVDSENIVEPIEGVERKTEIRKYYKIEKGWLTKYLKETTRCNKMGAGELEGAMSDLQGLTEKGQG